MRTDLKDRLRSNLTELADSTPVPTPFRFDPDRATPFDLDELRTDRSRWPVLIAACVAVALVGGLVAIRARDDTAVGNPQPGPTTPTPIPTGDAVLWAPDISAGGITITSRRAYAEEPGFWAGAVLAPPPTDTMFGLSVNRNTGDIADDGDVLQIAGFDVRAMNDSSAPDEIYRTVVEPCLAFGVNSAAEAASSPRTVALFDSITVTDGVVRLDLPTGWTSLGAGASTGVYSSTFDVTIDGVTTEVSMLQRLATPIGYLLAAFESSPEATVLRLTPGEPEVAGWVVRSATTPSYSNVIGQYGGTAFTLGGELPANRLVEIARTLVRSRHRLGPGLWTNRDNPHRHRCSGSCRVPDTVSRDRRCGLMRARLGRWTQPTSAAFGSRSRSSSSARRPRSTTCSTASTPSSMRPS